MAKGRLKRLGDATMTRSSEWLVAWLGIWVVGTACRFDLPMVPGIDTSSSDAPVVGSVNEPRCMGLGATCGFAGYESCCQAATVPGGDVLSRL